MRYLLLVLVWGAFLITTQQALAQTKKPKKETSPKSKTMTFQGVIKQKPWSKSGQSYCAQGSEYYVLVEANENEQVIQNESGQDLASFEGKQVTIQGSLKTKTIKASNNPMEQRPVTMTMDKEGNMKESDEYTCTVLVVNKIK